MAIITIDFMSASLMRNVTVNAIIPFDKLEFPGSPKRDKKPFKTLILLHGIFGNHNDWICNTRIRLWAEEKNLAVIMPAGENHFYLDCKATGERFSEFIGKELPTKMRELFHLSDKREDTFIAGLSMGGYGAIVNGLKYYDTFGYIAGLSSGLILDSFKNTSQESFVSTVFGDSYIETIFGKPEEIAGTDKDYKALILKLKEENAPIPKIYLCCGTEDHLLDANRDFVNFLKENGVDYTYEEGPGKHDWDFWDRYIKKVIDWLPLEDGSQGIHSGNITK